MSSIKNILGVGIAFSLASILVGCGGSGGSSSTSSTGGTGYYEDSAVAGADYKCGRESGVTGSDGKFIFEKGKDCTFKIGDMPLRTVDASLLKDGGKIIEDNITVATFLQSIDFDGNATNGLEIKDKVKEALKAEKLTTIPTDSKLADIIAMLQSGIDGFKGKSVSQDDAQTHLNMALTKATKALLSDKTFYAVDKDGKEFVQKISFDSDVTKFIHPENKDGNTIDSLTIKGNKALWGDKSYAIIVNKGAYLVFTDYTPQGVEDGTHYLYSKKEDAENSYYQIKSMIPFTTSMLDGKTFYNSHKESDNDISYCKFLYTKEKITYNCLVVNNKTGKISNDNGSNTYDIINGRLKTIWTDEGETDIWNETLKSQTSTQWTILGENDSNGDGKIDDIETTIWYIDKPTNYPSAL